MRDHARFRRTSVVITTTNNDSFLGDVRWSGRDYLELENVCKLGPTGRERMPGFFIFLFHSVAWVQQHNIDLSEEGLK